MIAHSRKAAVAGMFYPEQASTLRATVHAFLDQVQVDDRPPKAIIAPHAGYIYSGAVAAAAFKALATAHTPVQRIVLAGPSHFVPFAGVAIPDVDAFETPLGLVPVDPLTRELPDRFGCVQLRNDAHQREHCLETHLPFLQVLLKEFSIVPLVIGDARVVEVADVFDALWDDPGTVFSISSDLSHYHSYEEACEMDQSTAEAIRTLRPDDIVLHSACGRKAIQALLVVAGRRGLRTRVLDVRNSGDTAGPRDQVVGYGAFSFNEVIEPDG